MSFEIGQHVEVIDDASLGVVKGFSKKGRWDYVKVQTNLGVADFRPTSLRAIKAPPAPKSSPKMPADRPSRPTKEDDGPKVLAFIELELDQSYNEAAKILGVKRDWLHDKYKKLNLGMQKMNLTNRVRAHYRNK